MKSIIPTFRAALITAFMTATAHAQVGVSLNSGLGQIGAGAWIRESRVAPSLRYATGPGFIRLDASALERGGSLSLERAAIDGAVSSPAFGPLRLTVTGQYRDSRFDTAQVGFLGTALSAKYRGVGAWAGTSHERASLGQLNVGAWVVLRSALLTVTRRSRATTSIERTRFLVPDSFPSDTGWTYGGRWVEREHMSRSRKWSDLETRLDWALRRLALSAVMTTTSLAARDTMSQSRSVTWGHVNAAFMMNENVALVSTFGTLPTGPKSDAFQSRYATFGLRFSPAALLRDPPPPAVRPAASAFRLLPLERGTYRVVLRAPGARTVELSGDFNQWKAVSLTQTSPDLWEISLPLPAGTHRVNIRVNGDAWTAPPGLPSVNDEFSGRVGLLIVK